MHDNSSKTPNGDDAMKKLNNLVDKLFGVVKKEAEEIGAVVEEIIEPKPEADE